MKFFVASSYSSQVDYETGQVFPEHREFIESQLAVLEQFGEVFCAVRHDNYQINNAAPEEAFRLDLDQIKDSDVFIAFLSGRASVGVQTEIGIAVALGKRTLVANPPEGKREYFNIAMARAGVIDEISLPLSSEEIKAKLKIRR